MKKNIIELKDRQIVNVPRHPLDRTNGVRHFAVALDNEEALEFAKLGYRVVGDEEGPLLIIRLEARQPWPIVADLEHADVKFQPIEWQISNVNQSGIICWLEDIA